MTAAAAKRSGGGSTNGSPFAPDFSTARARFLEAAVRAGATVAEYHNPQPGPLGEPLYVSIAKLGAPEATRAVVTISGTHGVEGYCGSGCQVHWLENGFGGLPRADVAVIHIHAINPYGFAAASRGDEANIDLNRNFLADWQELPRNEGYEELASALEPEAWSTDQREAASARLDRYRETHGRAAWQAAIMGGQYRHPDGLFYGGRAPCWSNITFHRIVREHLAEFTHLTVIDLHTGLGPYAAMEVMVISPPATAGYERVQQWFGGTATSPYASTSNAQLVRGPLLTVLPELLPAADTSLVAIEFGTSETSVIIDALRADNWARRYAVPGEPAWQQVKQLMRKDFCPQDHKWERRVIEHATGVARSVERGLFASQ